MPPAVSFAGLSSAAGCTASPTKTVLVVCCRWVPGDGGGFRDGVGDPLKFGIGVEVIVS